MSDWFPIATAPTDGRRLLGAFSNRHVDVIWYRSLSGHGFWVAETEDVGRPENVACVTPTHWMSLPEAPL